MSSPLSRAALDALKLRQIAYFESRLVSAKAKKEWRALIEQTYAALLERRVKDLATPAAVSSAVEAALARLTVDKAPLIASKQIHTYVLDQLRADATPLGGYVPASARKLIDTFLERPKLIPEGLIREVFKQDALEEVLRDVLYDALKTFNDSVNPFFADWGLPALIKRFLPIGSGAVLKSMEAVRGEFDKRLEPEIRKFLQGFSRKALNKMANVAAVSSDGPKAIGVRQAIADWLYEQEMRSLVSNLDAAGFALGQEIGLEIAAHMVQMDVMKKRRKELIAGFFSLHDKHTLAEMLAHYGMTSAPDFDAIAAVSWPVAKAVLESGPVRAGLASLISEFFDSVDAS